MNDVETIQRVLDGAVDCFGLLIEKYQKKVVGMIYNMTRDHHLSEDLGQEVFTQVYRNLRSFDPDRSQFSTWLYRIAQNRTLNALKKKKPLFLAEVPETAGPGGIYQEMAANEFYAAFDRALAQLPLRQRFTFVWAEIEQLSYQEIAELEGVSLGTIKSRINRARQQIQAALPHHPSPSHE